MPADVAAAFAAFPEHVRARLLEARDLIFATAASMEGVGPLKETLKWGEPAYLSSDAQEGPKAFAEKRRPKWQGR